MFSVALFVHFMGRIDSFWIGTGLLNQFIGICCTIMAIKPIFLEFLKKSVIKWVKWSKLIQNTSKWYILATFS